MENNFKIGDRVTCNIYGIGEITDIDVSSYPICVNFESGIENYYTGDGRSNYYSKKVLFLIPKKKLTLDEKWDIVKKRYKELLNNTEAVVFKNFENNYNLSLLKHSDYNNINIYKWLTSDFEDANIKYISDKDAKLIKEEIEKLIESLD